MLGNKISQDNKDYINLLKIPFASAAGEAAALGWALSTGSLPARQFSMMTLVALFTMQTVGVTSSLLRKPQAVTEEKLTCKSFLKEVAYAEATIITQSILAWAAMDAVKLGVGPTIEFDSKGVGLDALILIPFLIVVLNCRAAAGALLANCTPKVHPGIIFGFSSVAEIAAILLLSQFLVKPEVIPGVPDYGVAGEAFALAVFAATIFHLFTDISINTAVGCKTGRSAGASRTARASVTPTVDSDSESASAPLLGAGVGMERPGISRTLPGAPLNLPRQRNTLYAASANRREGTSRLSIISEASGDDLSIVAAALPDVSDVSKTALTLGNPALNRSSERAPSGLALHEA